MIEDVKVSVCVVTYNQEKYIAECLQSLVDQVTDFKFEVIVGEDCSTDSTRKIVDKFAEKYPAIIIKNYHKKNVGAVENAVSTYRMAKGKYICHMDGDDGALPGKLDKTVRLLEVNPSCIMVTHDAIVVDKESKIIRNSLKRFEPGVYMADDLISNLPFFTNSAKMVKREACIDSLKLLHKDAVDVELHLLESRFGGILHLDTPLIYYRELAGVSSSAGRVNSLIVDGYVRVFESLIMDNGAQSNIELRKLKVLYAKALLNFSYQSLFFGKNNDAKKYAGKSLSIKVFSGLQFFLFLLSFTGPLPVFLVGMRRRTRGVFK